MNDAPPIGEYDAATVAGGPAVSLARVDLKRLTAKSNRAGLTRLAIHLMCVLASGSALWWFQQSAWVIALTLVHGYLLAFLFCAMHEAVHHTPFASRWLNDWVGRPIGFVLLLPFGAFQLFHWDHHRYTQDPQHDPELINGLPATRAALLWTWFGGPNWISRTSTLINHGVLVRIREPWLAAAQHRDVIREARIHLLGYALLFAISIYWQTTALIWLWLLPLFCGYWFLRPYLLCEHTGVANDGDMLKRTRTILTNPVIKLFAWNMPYHTEHHAYPGVPFHALPELHALMANRLINTEPGYLAAWSRVVRLLTRT